MYICLYICTCCVFILGSGPWQLIKLKGNILARRSFPPVLFSAFMSACACRASFAGLLSPDNCFHTRPNGRRTRFHRSTSNVLKMAYRLSSICYAHSHKRTFLPGVLRLYIIKGQLFLPSGEYKQQMISFAATC